MIDDLRAPAVTPVPAVAEGALNAREQLPCARWEQLRRDDRLMKGRIAAIRTPVRVMGPSSR
jgi:hypothetical protein